jgi:isoquinoline 1-oxidoreductase beta subunit
MNSVANLNRRSFLITSAATGGGLAIGLALPFGPEKATAQTSTPEIGAWVVIKPDDTVVVRVVRSEMGQGTVTGLCQLVAEELECDWEKVTWEYPTPGESVARKRVWGDFGTGGSRGIRTSHQYVRAGGAAAREMLKQAAANQWGVSAAELTVSKGVITHKASNRSTTYGKVAEAASKLEIPQDVKLKDTKDWTIDGKPLKRLDTTDKVIGKMIYGMDVKLPGMLNAAVKACPVFGGLLKSFDDAKVTSMPGVRKVVRVNDSAVAVVADTWWQAKTALEALPIVWDEGENAKVSSATIAAWLKEGLEAPEAFVGNSNGDAKAALANVVKTVEAVYGYPYQNHACLEPLNATALYTPDQMRGLDRHAERRSGVRRSSGSLRSAGREVRRAQNHPRRRIWTAHPQRLRRAGGLDRQADVGRADKADLVARRGHDAWHLPPGDASKDGGRLRRQQQSHRSAHPALGSVDRGEFVPAESR